MSSEENFSARGVDILIVEDSLTQAMKLEHVLKRHDHRVTVTRDGEQALGSLHEKVPRIVITDINMPKMNGYELCQHIKDDRRFADLPVILLTSLSDPKDILRGLECGADSFIVKPYDEEFLLSRIQHVLANQELRRQSDGKPVTEIYFAGHKYQLTSERIHSIDLLLSTYETAVQKNLELSKAKELLEQQAEQLREKNAQMEADLNMARELQTAFLPREYPRFPSDAAPEQSALRFTYRYRTTTELGGDFFDILRVSDHEAGIFICDVMGHGVRAALVTAIVRGLVEELAEVAGDPARFISQMNESLCAILKETLTPLFASAFYAVLDVRSGTVRYANAGHPCPYHLRRESGQLARLNGNGDGNGAKPGPALGVFERSKYPALEQKLASRDLLLFFTDGLYEVEGPDGVFYDQEKLTAAISDRSALPVDALFDALLEEVRAFSATRQFDDDVCLVGIEVDRVGV